MAEIASTYVVQDRGNKEELARLVIQGRTVTTAMGGALPEQSDPTVFRRVLDIGCGPGGWIFEAAQAYPEMKLYGIDISETIISYASKQAEKLQLPTDRVEFLVMDALRKFEFPDDSFDLVNFRFGVSFMRQWDWPKLFGEIQRVLKADGTVRIVEGEVAAESSSVAYAKFYALLRRALFRSGHLFNEEPWGLIGQLPSFLVRYGFQKIQSRQSAIDYRSATATGKAFFEEQVHLFHTMRPFLYRYGCMPEDYDAICQQATKDMQQADFVATNQLHTLWALNS
jgi:ubiquinone/menaquinone biosynthesis C-methylase UbiE